MKLRIFQVDAFASRPFAGNPAAVVPLDRWLDDATLLAIAAENNMAATAFVLGGHADYPIRWMTPTAEVELCGHATLAAGFVVMQDLEPGRREVCFQSRSGPLRVTRSGERLALDFPARPAQEAEGDRADVAAALGGPAPAAVLRATRDYLVVFESEAQVRELRPDLAKLAALPLLGLIATAPGSDSDFVSRFFAPAVGIDEDPATGSAHCTLVPYWSKRLGRKSFFARQVSKRGGELWCEDRGDRVEIAGHAVKFLEGEIELPAS
jgi:PhzF family phenazine biosynthesis protein